MNNYASVEAAALPIVHVTWHCGKATLDSMDEFEWELDEVLGEHGGKFVMVTEGKPRRMMSFELDIRQKLLLHNFAERFKSHELARVSITPNPAKRLIKQGWNKLRRRTNLWVAASIEEGLQMAELLWEAHLIEKEATKAPSGEPLTEALPAPALAMV